MLRQVKADLCAEVYNLRGGIISSSLRLHPAFLKDAFDVFVSELVELSFGHASLLEGLEENFHVVVPSCRSTVLKVIHLVSKPTQENMPLEKRCTSLSSRMESTIWRVIMR